MSAHVIEVVRARHEQAEVEHSCLPALGMSTIPVDRNVCPPNPIKLMRRCELADCEGIIDPGAKYKLGYRPSLSSQDLCHHDQRCVTNS